MILTTLRLNLRHPDVIRERADVCRMHSRVIDMTAGMPTPGPRVLWASPRRDLLVVRAPEPITAARLPYGYATTISYREWTPPTRAGRWRMVAVVNPGRHTRVAPAGGSPRRNEPPVLLEDPGEQAAWLARRLAAATVDSYRVTRTWTARGRHRAGTITVRCVAVAADITVHDPARVAAAVTGGVGMDKTWGCGLTVWEVAP